MIYFAAVELGRRRSRKAVKIGYSGTFDALRSRLHELQTASPVEVELLAVRPGSKDEEARLHERYAHEHMRGEWFRLTKRLDVEIEQARHADWHDHEEQ